MSKSDKEKEIINDANFIRSKTFFIKIFLIVACSILLCWSLMNISKIVDICGDVLSIFMPIIYGFCIAFIINLFMRPLESACDKIFKKKISFKIKRALCLTISIILVASIVFTVLFLIIPEITQTVYSLMHSLPEHINSIEDKLNEFEKNFHTFNFQFPELNTDELESRISKLLPEIGFDFVNKTFNLTSYIFSGIVTFVLSFFFAVYMLVQKEGLCLKLKKLLFAVIPIPTAKKILSWADLTNKTFTKFATGQLTEAVILGVLCFLGMIILRIPYPLIISVLIGFTALIPVFGAFIGIIIGAFLIVIVNPVKAIWFVFFVVILQQIEGNLIYPKVVGKSVGLPGILVLAAVTIGGNAFGVLGMLLSVPVFSVIYFGLKHFANRRLKERNIIVDPD